MIQSNVQQRPVDVLLVSSRALLRESLAVCLRRWGLQIAAVTPVDAASLVRRLAPRCVLADWGCGTTRAAIEHQKVPIDADRLLLLEDAGADGCGSSARVARASYVAATPWVSLLDEPAHVAAAVRRVVERSGNGAAVGLGQHDGVGAAPPNASLLSRLTPCERRVLLHLVQGLDLRACAARLGRSIKTVDNHKSRVMKKLGVHRTVDLVLLAIREGIVRPDNHEE